MNKKQYLKMRQNLYKQAMVLSKVCEQTELPELKEGLELICQGIDKVDDLGVRYGFLDSKTMDELSNKRAV